MGLFSGSTKIYVASSVYNLAGDVNERPNYMKTTVIGSILNSGSFSMSDIIQDSYLNGPGIRMRLFSSWSENKYDPYIGLASGSLGVIATIDPNVIASQIPPPEGETTYVQSSTIDFADFQQWCDKYLYDNAPERIGEKFEIDIDEDTNEITMTSLEGGSTIKFIPDNFEQGALYLYADYMFYKSPTTQPPVVGPTTTYDNEADLPSTFLWSTVSQTDHDETTPLKKTTVVTSVYSDGRPNEVVTTTDNTDYSWVSYVNVYSRGFSFAPDDVTVIIDNRVMTQKKIGTKVSNSTTSTNVVDIGGGVTRTDTTVVTTESVKFQYTSQTTSTSTIMTAAGTPHMLIYKRGDGNTVLDGLFDTYSTEDRFYPFIPIRTNKDWIEEDEEMYPLCKAAMRKSTGGKLPGVIESLKDNDDIDDIQYIYAVFGCSLNTPEDTAKEYIYRFFVKAAAAFPPDPNYPTLEDVIAGFENANNAAEAYKTWWENRATGSPTTDTPPPLPVYPIVPERSYRVSSNKGYKYDMTISWNYTFETTHVGSAWSGAKKGEIRTRYAGVIELHQDAFRSNDGKLVVEAKTYRMEEFEMLWQTGDFTYSRLRILGLKHRNNVYKNKSVYTSVSDAMGDAEESGFIVPLNTSIYRSMSLVRSTQLSTACTYLVLNCYKKVKQKWYTTTAFKVVVIVVAIVVSIFTFGAGGAGILGAYGAVGAALGFTGLAAVIVGAVANAIAAMVLMSIIQTVSTKLFGDKIGFIVSAIASVVAMNVGTALSSGASMSTMAASMMQADNIMMLTSSVGNGIAQYINASTVATMRKAEETMQQYNTDSMAIQKKYEEMFGTEGMGVIDPMDFVSIESMDTFLSRTLMTGSDIAGMSLDMVSNFTDMTLDLTLKE
jgi:hypothetical protein